MGDVRELAIQALLSRRGIAALFGRTEAEGDVAAIEAVVDLVAHGAGETCARCETLGNALDDPATRLFRTAEGELLVVSPEADPDEVAERVEATRAVELVPKPGKVAPRGERPISQRTPRSLGIAAEHEPLRAIRAHYSAIGPTGPGSAADTVSYSAPAAWSLTDPAGASDATTRERALGTFTPPPTGRGYLFPGERAPVESAMCDIGNHERCHTPDRCACGCHDEQRSATGG